MNLTQELTTWDGKSAAYISAVFERHASQKGFIDRVLNHVRDTSCQPGATWLLKKWLESGGRLDASQIDKLYGALDALQGWTARLHVLQCISHVPIAAHHKLPVEAFVRANLADDNKFVRAWSYNAFHELAGQHPEYAAEVKQLFEMAMRDESASVKARIRNAGRR